MPRSCWLPCPWPLHRRPACCAKASGCLDRRVIGWGLGPKRDLAGLLVAQVKSEEVSAGLLRRRDSAAGVSVRSVFPDGQSCPSRCRSVSAVTGEGLSSWQAQTFTFMFCRACLWSQGWGTRAGFTQSPCQLAGCPGIVVCAESKHWLANFECLSEPSLLLPANHR